MVASTRGCMWDMAAVAAPRAGTLTQTFPGAPVPCTEAGTAGEHGSAALGRNCLITHVFLSCSILFFHF